MIKTAKVFIWIGMIFQFFLIYPIVVGIIALQKLNEARKKEEIQTIGILTLLFCNIISGIIMLSMTDKDLSQIKNVKTRDVSYKQIIHYPNKVLHRTLAFVILGLGVMITAYSRAVLIKWVLICTSILLLIMVFLKKRNNTIYKFIPSVIICLSILYIVLDIIYFYIFKMTDDWTIFCLCMTCLSSLINMVLAFIILFTTIKNKDKIIIKEEEVFSNTTTDGIEYELKEVKSLFENNLINEQEYNLAKQEIIKKYYN